MKTHQYPPHPILSAYVKCLWTSERDDQPPHDVFEVLPDTDIELVFSFGGRTQIETTKTARTLPSCYLVGLLSKPCRLRSRGVVKTVAARFYAWGFNPLLGYDAEHLPILVREHIRALADTLRSEGG
jgi:uncharacterized protein DUF6597